MANERKEKIIRLIQILENTDEKTPINAAGICDILENDYNIGNFDRRTIYKDINMLEECGYRIKQSTSKKEGWYMDKHLFDDWEIKIMMDSVKNARCITAAEAKEIEERLLSLTSTRSRIRFTHMMETAIGNVEAEGKIGSYIETMLEAIYTSKKIAFRYTEINDDMERVYRKDGSLYTLNLYALDWSDNNYYLIGAHDKYGNLVNYRLDRIDDLVMTEETSTDPREMLGPNPELIIQDYIVKNVRHFSGEEIKIEVEYTPGQIENAILYDFAAGNLKVEKLENGMCRAKFVKMNSITLVGWFLQYANMYKVKEPQSLRDEVKKRLKEAVKWYKE